MVGTIITMVVTNLYIYATAFRTEPLFDLLAQENDSAQFALSW